MPPSSQQQDVKIIDMRKFQEQETMKQKEDELDAFLDDDDDDEQSSGNGSEAGTEVPPAGSEAGTEVPPAGSEAGTQEETEEETDDDFQGTGAPSSGGRSRRRKIKDRLRQRRDSSSSSASEASSTSTTRMLSSDPLFLVLYQYLVNNKGENIVTVLDKINKNLKKLVTLLGSD